MLALVRTLSIVVDMLVRGSVWAWGIAGGLCVITMVAVLLQRRGRRSSGVRVLALVSLASATAMAGVAVACAVAMPRLRWVTKPDPALVRPSGDTWRLVRGPSVAVITAGEPDLAIPTIDADGQWVLVGLLSARPIPGLSPAPPTPPAAGAPRLCATDGEICRAWPSAWPDPAQAPRSGDLIWTREGPLSTLAFDVESGRYLSSLGSVGGPDRAMELLGRLSNDPPRDMASSLFILRRIVGVTPSEGDAGAAAALDDAPLPASARLQSVRVVSTPVNGSYTYVLQRSDISLAAGSIALRFVAFPLIIAALVACPLAFVGYLISPFVFAVWLRRKSAKKRSLDKPLTLKPIPSDSATLDDAILCAAASDTTFGDAPLSAGGIVRVVFAGHSGEPITSRTWFELPAPVKREGPPVLFRSEPEAPPPGSLGSNFLIPADTLPFAGAAGAWLTHRLHPLALCAAGMAVSAPGIVAVVSLLSAR